MNFLVILNRDGGTLRSMDARGFGERIRETLENAGHRAELRVVGGKEVIAAIEEAARTGKAVSVRG